VLTSLKSRICLLISLMLALVAAFVLYFTHRDVVMAMSGAEQRSVRNVLELAELNIRSGYANLLYSRVDAVMAHRRMLEGMVHIATKGLDEIFSTSSVPGNLPHPKKEEALRWINGLASMDGSEFLILDSKGTLLAHPDSGIRGKNLNILQDIKGIPLADAVREEATRLGRASTTFFWTLSPDGHPTKKFGWFVHYPAMDWIIGATANIEALEQESERKKQELLKNLKANFDSIRIARSGYMVIFDTQGTLLIGPDHGGFRLSAPHPDSGNPLLGELQILAASKTREPMRLVLSDPRGELRESEIFSTYFKTLGWYVAAIAYVDEIHAPARDLVQRLSLIIATLFLISLALGLWLSVRMTRPLNTLASYAQALPEADFTSSTEASHSIRHLPLKHKDEVGRLARALIFMEGSLRENIRSLIETTAINERMEGELNVAREIQLGLLPKTFPPFPHHGEFDLYASLEPAREVGGDLYDFFFMDENRFCFAVGDVSGKGVPASLFMAITRTLFRAAAVREKNPASIMASMNNDLASSNPNSMFVTLFIGVLDLATGALVYANGGHNPPVLLAAGKPPLFMTGRSGPLVGAMEDMPYVALQTQLDPGDTLFLYTDGVTEAMDANQTLYSDERLLRTLSTLTEHSPKALLRAIEGDVALHVAGAEPSDDITMLCLRYAGHGESAAAPA
jgi:sigma-B regulation protein RsbU (phosphoserine phosphatase)